MNNLKSDYARHKYVPVWNGLIQLNQLITDQFKP